MAFESLTDKLQNVFKNLRSKGRLTEEDVKSALKEVKMALLEADVNFKVVKQFVKAVEERAIGQDVMNGLNPGQMVIKIVNEEMVNLMGSETTEIAMQPGKAITVIMMAGLQGAGKTTATAKIAGKLKLKGKKPLLVACDIYRPAAIEQLQINGKKQEVDVFSMGTDHKPAEIAKKAIAYAEKNGHNVVILDTAGRLHVDEDMMAELQEIKETVTVHQTLLVVDAMTGQDAVNVAKEFDEKLFDMIKLLDIGKTVISKMTAEEVYNYSLIWAKEYDEELAKMLEDKEYALKVFGIERGNKKPRKDISKWSDVMYNIGYMYDDEFYGKVNEYPYQVISDKEDIAKILDLYISKYYNESDDKQTWFDKIKELAVEMGYAGEVKEFKANPGMYKAHVGDVSTVLRVALTARTNTPDMYEIMQVLGKNRIAKRLEVAKENLK